MIRRFFIDCVIAVAICCVVWGSSPAWAACLCTSTVVGVDCDALGEAGVKNGHEGFLCKGNPVCGSRPGYLWGRITCKCDDFLTFWSKTWWCECMG
jgi:hypothetical protein